MDRSKELKIGAIIAYFTIIINIFSGFLYTPWLVKQIGDSDYGLYTLANSLINLFLFDFGLSAATSRFVSKYLAEGRQDKVDRILGTIYKLYFIIDAVIMVVLAVVLFFLEEIYSNLTASEIQRFRVVYIMFAFYALVSFPCVTFTGILNAYEKFITLKIADTLYRIFSVIITIVVLICGGGLYALVSVHIIVGLLILAYKYCVIKIGTPVKINFVYKEKGLYRELFSFSFWITVSTLAQRLIIGITPSVLGVVSSTAAIAVFGIIMVIENYIHIITTALNGMFMPRIARIFTEKDYINKLNNLIVMVGRLQFALNGLIVTGFLLLGKDFIKLWMGESYGVAYYGILLVTIPNLFYNSMQIANTALVVKNHVKIQAVTNVIVGIINVVLSIVLSKCYGVFGACVSIFVACNIRNVGYFIAYYKILNINIKKIGKECYLGTGISILMTVALGIPLNYIFQNCDWFYIVIKAGIIVICYFVFIFVFSLRREERKRIKGMILKRIFRRNI